MRGDGILYLVFFGPPVASVVIALVVVVALIIQSRLQLTSSVAWPAIGGAVVLPLAAYATLFVGGHRDSTLGAMNLMWIVAGGFCVLGLVDPPPPTRRWMFAAGLASVALGVLCIMFLTAFGRSMGQMH